MCCRCVPSPFTKEAALVLLQGSLLIIRTLMTLQITKFEGKAGKYLTSQVMSFLALLESVRVFSVEFFDVLSNLCTVCSYWCSGSIRELTSEDRKSVV